MKTKRLLQGFVGLCAVVSGALLVLSLVGGINLEYGPYRFRSTSPVRPLLVFVVAGLLSLLLSRREGPRAALPVRAFAGLKKRVVFPRQGTVLVKSVWIAVAALLLVHVGFFLRQVLLIPAAERLEAVGQNLDAGETYLSAAAWPLAKNRLLREKAGYCFYRCGEFERVRAVLEAPFEREEHLSYPAHRALFMAYANLGHKENARRVHHRSLQVHPQRSPEVLRALEWLDRSEMVHKSDAPAIVIRCPSGGVEAISVEIAGNWTAQGEYSDLSGWQPAPMQVGPDGTWSIEVALPPSRELPYLCVARATLASGDVVPIGVAHFTLPLAASARGVELRRVETPTQLRLAAWRPKPADGRRRVLALWPDCGSWPILRLCTELGYMPYTRALQVSGAALEMISTYPPFTATAYLRMIGAGARDDESGPGWVRLAAMQVNGIPYLDWLIPDSLGTLPRSMEDTLYRVLERNGHPAVAMVFNDTHLFAEDDLAAAPDPETGAVLAAEAAPRAPARTVALDLTLLETQRFLTADEASSALRQRIWEDNPYLQYCLDNSAENARRALSCWVEESPDFLLVRLPAVDLASHKYFATIAESPEHNPMSEVYRQVDVILGLCAAQVDADDTLILVSDHGIASMLVHDRSCIFIAAGPGIPAGKTLGTVPIDHFPSLVCARFGIEGVFSQLTEGERAAFHLPRESATAGH